jgi:DNA-binding MarR family transcriptional regulator
LRRDNEAPCLLNRPFVSIVQPLTRTPVPKEKKSPTRDAETARRVLRHWHEAVPNDRMAHLVKDATRGFLRALQGRLAAHGVPLGHWTFLRILWQRDGLTQRELSLEAGVMEPTTFVALRAMASLGYVTLEQRADNRKNVYVLLTPLGRGLRDTLVPLAEEVNAVAVRGIEPAALAATRQALLVMIDNLAGAGGSAGGTAPRPGRRRAVRSGP